MKKYIIFPIILLCINLNYAKAENDTLFIDSEIIKATVYPNGARLSRLGTVNVKTGITTVVFKNITDMFSVKGIQINSDQNIKLLGIMARQNYKDVKETNKEINFLSDKIIALQKKVKFEQTLMDVYRKEENMITANQKVISKQKDLTIEEITKIADFYHKRLSELQALKLKSDRKTKEYNNEIDKIRKQLNELSARKKVVTNEILVSLSSTKVQKLNLTAEYFTNNAGWTPVYDIRVDDISKPVNLIYKADVHQNTGNDWKNVAVTLSAGNPSQSNTAPTITPWKLYFVNYNYKQTYAKNNAGRASHVFVIKNKYTIPSDGKNHSMEVDKYSLDAEYEYYAVPKQDTKAYLTARVTEWEKYHLLNGKTNLFFEGTLIGESVLDMNTSSDTIDISLGEDKNIVIEREKLKNYNKRQYVGNKQVEERAFEIKIRNNKKRKIKLRIEDQIPVSKNDEIDVKLISYEGAKVEEVSGKITWVQELDSNKSTTLKFHYSVKYPKKKTLQLE